MKFATYNGGPLDGCYRVGTLPDVVTIGWPLVVGDVLVSTRVMRTDLRHVYKRSLISGNYYYCNVGLAEAGPTGA